MGMVLVESVTVGSGGASSIEFTSIPQDGVDLLLMFSARSTVDDWDAVVQFNADTTTYTSRVLRGNGSSASSATYNGHNGVLNASGATASTFGNSSVYISNYTSSVAKSFGAEGVGENNATLGFQVLSANSWDGTSAITSVKLSHPSGNLVQYSTASLYKITAD